MAHDLLRCGNNERPLRGVSVQMRSRVISGQDQVRVAG